MSETLSFTLKEFYRIFLYYSLTITNDYVILCCSMRVTNIPAPVRAIAPPARFPILSSSNGERWLTDPGRDYAGGGVIGSAIAYFLKGWVELSRLGPGGRKIRPMTRLRPRARPGGIRQQFSHAGEHRYVAVRRRLREIGGRTFRVAGAGPSIPFVEQGLSLPCDGRRAWRCSSIITASKWKREPRSRFLTGTP